MPEQINHAVTEITRHATDAISRRGSLLTLLGAAVVAAVAFDGERAQAGKQARKARRRSKKKCGRQVAACRTAINDRCDADPECVPEILAEVLACCDEFRDCRAGVAISCLYPPADNRR